MKRRFAAALIAVVMVAAGMLIRAPIAVAKNGLSEVTGSARGQEIAAGAANRFRALGVRGGADGLAVYALEDGSYLVGPRGSQILGVQLSVDPVSGEETFGVNALPPPDEVRIGAGVASVEQSEVGALAAPYWALVGSHCWSRTWYDSSSVWMDTCYHKHKMMNDGSGTWDYFELHMFATGASASKNKLKDLNIWAGPASGSPTQSWHAFYPASDMSGGNCGQITVGFTTPPVGIGYTHNWCDKWDMTKYTTGGAFRNIYVAPLFFEPIGSEREVAFTIATKVGQGKTASWVFSWVGRRV